MSREGESPSRGVYTARIGLALASIGLVFVLGEIALRVVAAFDREHIGRLLEPPPARSGEELRLADLLRPDPDPLVAFTLRPGVRGRFRGMPIRINRLGMRGPELGKPPPNAVRIALLGDSHTFGWGVAWDDTFGARLAALLGERAGGRVVDVQNLGVPGYNAVQEVRTFERQLEALQPDFAVIYFVGNDADLPNFLYSPPNVWPCGRHC